MGVMAMWDPPRAEPAPHCEESGFKYTFPLAEPAPDCEESGFKLTFPDPVDPPVSLIGITSGTRNSIAPELSSPRNHERSGVAPTLGITGNVPIHPQRWTEDQVRSWWERRTRKRKDVGALSKGTDGRNIMRWPIARFEQVCNGNAGIAVALYQDLRNEIEKYEQWKRSSADDSGFPVSSPMAASGGLSSPRGESTKKVRMSDASKLKARSPCYPNDSMASDCRRTSGASEPIQEKAKGVEPRRVGEGVKLLQEKMGISNRRGERPMGAGSVHVPIGGSGQEGRRASAPCTKDTAPCQRVQVTKASFKFAPGPRRDSEPSNPVPQRRIGTPSEASTREEASAEKATSKEAAAASRKERVKSAPRASRIPATAGQTSHATPIAPSLSHVPPAAHERGAVPPARQRATTERVTVTTAASSSAGPSSSASAGKSASKTSARKSARAKVMEDLKDDELAQVGTPKKPSTETSWKEGGHRERLSIDSRMTTKRAADDSAISRKPKANSGETAEEEDVTTRRMFDKRLLRRMHKEEFTQTLAMWNAQHAQDTATHASDAASSRVRVCVRKRPLFENEVQADEFDVISVHNSEVVVHNCLTKADLKTLFVSHMAFPFSRAFGESITDDEVYAYCAAPAVEHTLQAGVATIFMFGQTGSGKTHTMRGLLQRTIAHLFRGRSARGGSHDIPISLTAFEIAGKNIRDLLDLSGAQKEVKVMEDKGHRTHVLGVCRPEVNSASELFQLLDQAAAHRTTRATQVNDTSSRSHAVYRIWLGSGGAVLTLVDCAGSERREDSSHHDSQSRKDAAEINSTIFALKECFRVMRSSKAQQAPPYRDSLLTRVLSDSFANEHALIMAIGTVSPSASDTEHSIGTLRALQQLQGTQMSYESREDVVFKTKVQVEKCPRHWSEEDVRHWVEGALNGRARSHVAGITKGTDGKNLIRWPQMRFIQLCGGDDDLGALLYQDLRQKIRVAGA